MYVWPCALPEILEVYHNTIPLGTCEKAISLLIQGVRLFTSNILYSQKFCGKISLRENIIMNIMDCSVIIFFDTCLTGADPGGVFGVLRPPLQKYIREAKRMMYWYKNTLKCIIS